jgi:hypothetical protein
LTECGEKASMRPVVEAGADVDHQVAAMHGHVGLVEPVHAEHAHPVLARAGIGAKAHQGRGDRKAGGLDQFAQQLAGGDARVDHAAAGVEDRAFGLFHQLDQLGDRLEVALDPGLVVADARLLGLGIVAGGELHVLRDVDQHRAGAAVGSDVKGLVDGVGQAVGVLHQPVHLGAGAGDADGVGLLEGVRADHEGGHLAGQHHDRDGIHQRVGQARHGIGGAGPRGHQHHAGLTGGPRIALGHVHGGLFVAHQDVADVVLLEDLVIDRQHGAARIAEYSVHSLIPQGLNHHLRTGHRLRHCRLHRLCPKKSPRTKRGRCGVEGKSASRAHLSCDVKDRGHPERLSTPQRTLR